MADTLRQKLSDIRAFLYGGIQTLPVTIAGTFLVLGLFTAHYAMLFFLVGFFLSGLASKGLNLALNKVFTPATEEWFSKKKGGVCEVFIPFETYLNAPTTQDGVVFFSEWMAMVAFFLGYMFMNGSSLYTHQSPPETVSLTQTTPTTMEVRQEGETARTSQSLISTTTVILLSLFIFFLRWKSGCEGFASIALTTVVFLIVGGLWFIWSSSFYADRKLTDLFGIANRLLPPSALENKPVACFPTGL